jgi:hypothetical protein
MIKQKLIIEKYDEISLLETLDERREFLLEQSEEMKVNLWLENIKRKTKAMELSDEQREILEVIKQKFVTVEFAESVKGKSEEETEPEYHRIMAQAVELLGKDNLRELLFILGGSGNLKQTCYI